MTWVLNLGEHPSLASNSWISLFPKFEAFSDDMTVAIPVCINKSMIASHTYLTSNLFSGYTAGHRVQLSTIQKQYLWLMMADTDYVCMILIVSVSVLIVSISVCIILIMLVLIMADTYGLDDGGSMGPIQSIVFCWKGVQLGVLGMWASGR